MANEIRDRVDFLLAWKRELEDQLRDLAHRLSVTGNTDAIDSGAESQRHLASQRIKQTQETIAYVQKELMSYGEEAIHASSSGTDSIGGDLSEYQSEGLS